MWYKGKWYGYGGLAAEYKVIRINEMACIWKGKKFEEYTVPLLAMLVQENGALAAERWHDCYASGVCHGLGLTGYSICSRGMDGTKFCSWKDGETPQDRFAEKYPELATEWQAQFYHYSDQIRGRVEKGDSSASIIQSWNSGEADRVAKVKRWEKFIRISLNLE